MYKSLEISQQRRKRIAAILLINFLFSTVLFAFPQSKCDGMCSIGVVSHECSSMAEMTCCDMMDMNSDKTTPFEMEITDNSCDYVIDTIDDFSFLIPKSIDTKIDLSEIAIITIGVEEKTSTSFVLSNNIFHATSPPIFKTISSYLI